MSFAVSGETYDRFMGRYSRLLAPRLADFAGIGPPACAVDVGCGPGALTTELAAWRETGLRDVETAALDVAVEYEDFDD
jgi:16S rRNA G1207 methylase RsmC